LVLPGQPLPAILYVWDGLVIAFLFSWSIGLLTELQRSEDLSLTKFLHLPVSLAGAFLVNYVSSLLSLSLIVFLPPMLGLSLGLIFGKGPALLVQLPLLAAFLLMITALTYQFQGWLASLMVNKRRRRTIIVVVTVVFILLFQLPNLLNILRPWDTSPQGAGSDSLVQEQLKKQEELQRALAAGEITPAEFNERLAQLAREYAARRDESNKQAEESDKQAMDQLEHTIRLANVVLPLGWLPLGALDAAQGNLLPALLGTLGMGFIGTVSLWRSYRTTMRLYRGEFTSGTKRSAVAAPPPQTAKGPARLLEKQLPWVSEQVSAIALASFRSLLRAPEAKMTLLSPIFMVIIFGAMFARQSMPFPVAARPLLPFGAMAIILLSMVQLIGNQFGFDRNGFRVYVLCAAPRGDILMGKNLAVAPLALGMGVLMLLVIEVIRPLRVDHFLAALPQMVSMYFVFCMLANWLSIVAPVPVAAGSFKMSNVKGIALVLHILLVFLFPVALAPMLLPLGIEVLLQALGCPEWVPISLVLSLLECVAVIALYHLVLGLEGGLLQAREKRILEVVRVKAE
jgi:hypothetical protein